VIRQALEDKRLLSFQYSPFGGQTLVRRAVADHLRDSHKLGFAYDDIILTPGAMAALNLALRVAARPGGEVLIPVPCWLDYHLYARSIGLTPVEVPLTPTTLELNVASVAEAITERTCAVLFSHPSNPTGRICGSKVLEELGRTIQDAENDLRIEISLICDEAHRDFTAPGEYRSAATSVNRSLVVYSFGKYHFMQGQRIGYVAVSPNHPCRRSVSAELIRWARILGVATPTALMQWAVPKLLGLKHDLTWLTYWRQRFVDELSTFGYSVVKPEATLFVYVQTPAGYGDFEFIEALASAGLLALPAPVFHHTGYFRLSLTGLDAMLERALPILKRFAPK
jgi:aspartate aminotransferase